jgi:peptide chain release factor 1
MLDLNHFIERFQQRFQEVEAQLSAPDAFTQPQKGQELTREHARLKGLVEAGERWRSLKAELAENKSMVESEPEDSEMHGLAAEEVERLKPEVQRWADRLTLGIVPPDPTDSRNTVVEIRAGAGGAESALFAAELFRVYTRYAESQGWRLETLDASPSDLGGLKEVIFLLTGQDIYKRMKFESGVHRVQRVPATEAQGRIHTSTVTVAVLPEAEEVDIEIRPEDLDIKVCRAGGHGGQGVNTTDSAVQIFHKPSGLTVRCQDERSQLKNKAKALMVLRSRLLEKKQSEENARYAAHRKSQVGMGDRSEKIRTYNFPQNRMTDHRVDLTLYNLNGLMEGDLDEVIDALAAQEASEKLAAIQV